MNSKTAALSTSAVSASAIATKRAAIYCRISSDKTGDELGVTRQREDGEALCLARGFDLVGVFVDNDISATRGAPRPKYRDLMDAVDRGELDVIVVWQLSRLWRNRRERADGLERLSAAHVSIVAVKGQDLDLSTASGRTFAAILGEFDTMESEVKSERMVRQQRQAAEAGKVSSGGSRPFGYGRDRLAILEDEAAVIRDCARRVLAGESLRSVASGINARGARTALDNPWSATSLRQVLASARISGRREHRPSASYKGGARPLLGEIVSDAEWPGIITHDESDRLRALLTNPARRRSPAEARKTVLSGILRCCKCGTPMVSRPRQGQPRYCCISDPGRGGCGRMVVDGARTDARVRDLVVQLLADSPAFAERLQRPDDAGPDMTAQLRADEDRLEELAADYAIGDLTRAEWKAARQVLAGRMEAARARMARATGTTALAGFLGPREGMLSAWNERLNNSQRRAVVQAVTEHIEVAASSRPGVFDPERIRPLWRA